MTFEERLLDRIRLTGSNLCIGLDPRADAIEGDVDAFLERVIGETGEFAAAFKPNIAYFEALGVEGYRILDKILESLVGTVPVVLDVKRSDIGETQRHYAKAYFENWDVDAVTLNPLLGFDSIEPFLQYEGKGVYLLAVTSNPGAKEFLLRKHHGAYLFEDIQRMHKKARDLPGSVGLVAGLTNLSDAVLGKIADVPLLIPGLGAQGGDLKRLQPEGRKAPLLVNVSRGVLYGDETSTPAARAEDYMKRIKDILG